MKSCAKMSTFCYSTLDDFDFFYKKINSSEKCRPMLHLLSTKPNQKYPAINWT